MKVKKLFIVLGTIVGLLIVGLVVLSQVDFNRLGKENVYVQITADGELEETRLDSGEVMKRYLYNLEAYNEKGEPVQVEFSAAKNLRVGAYLMLYMKKDELTVTSYDEVQEADIPTKAIEKLKTP